MVPVDDAARMAMDLPDVVATTSYGNRAWAVGKTVFAWQRPFRKADLRRFGKAAVPEGPIFAVRVASLAAKDAALAGGTRGVFTIPHFDGYAALLVQLDVVAKRVLQRLLVDAWLASAPASLADRLRARR